MSLPLPELTFYRMADVSPASATIDGLLDAVYTALTAVTDYRGTAVASTHQWVVGRQVSGVTVAVYATPPVGTAMGRSPALVVAGSSAAATPTMQTPDTYTTNNVLFGLTLGAGAWTAWDSATPSGGTFSGYWRAAGTTWNATGAKVRVFVSEEVIFFQLIGLTVTSQAWFGLGAIVEPHLSYVDSVGLDAETDDRLYGMWTSGSTASMTAVWLSAMSASTPFSHSTTANQAHMMVFQPGTASTYTCGRKLVFQATGTSAMSLTSAGAFVGDLIALNRNSATLAPGGVRLGMLRSTYPIGSIQSGRTLRDGATDLYHTISPDTSAAADALFLKAVS